MAIDIAAILDRHFPLPEGEGEVESEQELAPDDTSDELDVYDPESIKQYIRSQVQRPSTPEPEPEVQTVQTTVSVSPSGEVSIESLRKFREEHPDISEYQQDMTHHILAGMPVEQAYYRSKAAHADRLKQQELDRQAAERGRAAGSIRSMGSGIAAHQADMAKPKPRTYREAYEQVLAERARGGVK